MPVVFVGGLTALIGASGCRQETPPTPKPINYEQKLPPGEKALRKLPPERYPDFSVMVTDRAALVRSIDQSLAYLSAPSSRAHFPYLDITHDRAVRTLQALRELAARPGTVDWNREIPARFEVYQSVGAPSPETGQASGQVLFTAYCTPVYEASLTRGGAFQWPLYKRPSDLVVDHTGEGVYRRGSPPPPAAGLPTAVASERYWTRGEIEGSGHLAGQELVWLKSRWEAYVVTVQGSARLRLTDGRIYEVGYAGSNGHDYVSPGRQMVADGVIPQSQLSLRGLGDYFRRNPDAMDRYLWLNPRLTFFTERPGGPFGSLNVPVTPYATIATDKEVFPRAMPAFVSTQIRPAPQAEPRPFRAILLDQDTGGAIRSAGRCDLYLGIGPQAEGIAGGQLFAGQLYYLAVR
jgi:membrane-bound lytic murein transglycosylase A